MNIPRSSSEQDADIVNSLNYEGISQYWAAVLPLSHMTDCVLALSQTK